MILELSLNLATALGVGLLIGTERSGSGRGNNDDMEELAGARGGCWAIPAFIWSRCCQA